MKKSRTHPGLLTLLAALPAILILYHFFRAPAEGYIPRQKTAAGSPMTYINRQVSKSFPFSRTLRQMGIELRYKTGETQQEGIYVDSAGLLLDIEPPSPTQRSRNVWALQTFSQLASERGEGVSTYVTVIPTASAVMQQSLPRFSSPYNQRLETENIYNQLLGELTTIDVYSTLIGQQDKYLYYRTDDRLTSLGGYYVYRGVLERMLEGEKVTPLSSFEFSYGEEFYGPLYQKVPYTAVSPDREMFFHYTGIPVQREITQEIGEEVYTYDTLYPTDDRGNPTVLHDVRGCLEIQRLPVEAEALNLLVFGDYSGTAYLPFFTSHYRQVTFINVEDEVCLDRIDLDGYDQILFALSLDTFLHEEVLYPVVALARQQWAM